MASTDVPAGNADTTASIEITTEDEVKKFLNTHIWLPVLGSLLLFAIAVIVSYCICRLRRRNSQRHQREYQNLDEDWTLTSKVELQKRRVKVAQRDTALLNCSFFLRSSGEYTLLDHLPEIGSQDNKQWFLVRHKDSCVEYVLTVCPKVPGMVLPFTQQTVNTISELVLTLQHPYIHPLRELAFQMDVEHMVTIYPYNRGGSLRDHIYTARCLDSWGMKYGDKGQPLELPTVRLYGKQILQALLFLKDKGFPFFGHLHSGNVMVVDNTCRLCGYEGTLLSMPLKLQQLLKRYIKTDMRLFDVICFGHLLYEMVTGFQLDTAVPESRHYVLIHTPQVVEILQYIFSSQANEYPSIKKLSQHVFFKHVKLKEMETYSVIQSVQPPAIKSMLKSIKKAFPVKKKPSVPNTDESRKRSESQASISSKSSFSSSVASSSKTRKSSPKLLPLTPVLSESEKSHPLEGEVFAGTSKQNPYPERERSRTQEVTENMATSERTTLLSDIKKGTALRKTGTFSNKHPRV